MPSEKIVSLLASGADVSALSLEEQLGRIELIRHKLKFIERKPKVACIEGLSPFMLAVNLMPEMVAIAGGIPVLPQSGKPSSFVDFEILKSEDPDVIVIVPLGFFIAKTLQEINLLIDQPGWNELAAVKNGRVYIADGEHYFNPSGPQIVDSIEILAEIINPKQFIFGHEGTGWVHFG